MASKRQELKAVEEEIARLQARAESLRQSPALQAEIEFEEKLHALLKEYGKDLVGVIALLDPKSKPAKNGRGRTERVEHVYRNPNTGETVTAKGGNNKTLRAWKDKWGVDTVKSWRQ